MKHYKVTGFASPAQGYEMQGIDLNGLIIRRPNATFFFRVEDDTSILGVVISSIQMFINDL